MKLQTASSLMLLTLPSLASAGDAVLRGHASQSPRMLKTMTEMDCYAECVKQSLSADQCVEYIKSVLGEDLSGSQYPDLQIKISRPRPPATKEATYWEIGIPTNVFGEVSCNIKGGTISYRDPWVTKDGPQDLPDTNCIGLNAAQCCETIKTNVAKAGISLTDVNGNCLSCWAHQEILTPSLGKGGDVSYMVYAQNENEECEAINLPAEKVQAIDDEVEADLVLVSNDIDRIIKKGASCRELRALQDELTLKARSFHRVMVEISSFLCGLCDKADTVFSPIPKDMQATLMTIQEAIKGEIKSDENCIVIYADHGDFVMEPPKVGGSRAELDFDRDDPDCDGEEPSGPDPNDPPPTDPDGGEYYDEIPEDDGNCSPLDLANMSKTKEDSCYQCRRCLLQRCEWDEGRKCRKIFKFKVEGTAEEWKWCLENNGGMLTKEEPVEGQEKNWCACSFKCEKACVRQGPRANPKKPRDLRCTAQNIASASGPGEKCEDCKACIQEKCGSWKNNKCNKILKGEKKGSKQQWAACLNSNGSLSSLPDGKYNENDGQQDNWSKSAKSCSDRCMKVKTKPDRNTGPVCTMNQLAKESSENGDVCFDCRKCIGRKCDYWQDKCKAMMMGEETGTPDEWTRCMETCGRGLSKEGRNLGSSTCECFGRCEDQCRTPGKGDKETKEEITKDHKFEKEEKKQKEAKLEKEKKNEKNQKLEKKQKEEKLEKKQKEEKSLKEKKEKSNKKNKKGKKQKEEKLEKKQKEEKSLKEKKEKSNKKNKKDKKQREEKLEKKQKEEKSLKQKKEKSMKEKSMKEKKEKSNKKNKKDKKQKEEKLEKRQKEEKSLKEKKEKSMKEKKEKSNKKNKKDKKQREEKPMKEKKEMKQKEAKNEKTVQREKPMKEKKEMKQKEAKNEKMVKREKRGD